MLFDFPYSRAAFSSVFEVDLVIWADNAIPVEGWISDPTDNHLLHLIPLLEGMQHVTDVRAVLGLRMGEPNAVSSTAA